MAKQLFNSTEKSNFILNLTEEKYSKMAAIGLVIACFGSSVGTIFPLLTGEKNYALTAAGLSIAGVICMIIAIIGIIKKYINGKLLVPVGILGTMLLWTVFSVLHSVDKGVGFYGFPGRGEGLLAFVFYGCFFVAAAAVKREKALKIFIVGIIAAGLLSSAIAVAQVFGGVLTEFLFVGMKTEINAASGLCQSPMFLAMVLSIAIMSALTGFVLFEKKASKVICLVSAAFFSFIIMFTYSLIGIVGAVLAIIGAVVLIIAAKAPKLKLLSVFAVILPAVASVLIVNCGIVGNISEYKLYDGRILWYADSFMRLSASGIYDPDVVDIDSTEDVYYTLNRKTMDIISNNGALGTGPDQLAYPQIFTLGEMGDNATVEDVVAFNKGVFDRVYNEYLYVAATRGIPAAFLFAAFLAAVVIIGIGAAKKSRSGYSAAMVIMTVMGAVIFLISCSNTAFSPIFWGIAGCACAMPGKEKEPAAVKADKPVKEEKAEKAPKEAKAEKPEKAESPKKQPAKSKNKGKNKGKGKKK